MIYKSLSTEVKEIDEAKRRIRFIATTHEVDREGDVVHIMPNKKGQGLLVPRGDKTPLKTFHDYRSYPIGFARDWELSHRKATYNAEFFGPEISEEADLAFRVAKTGVLSNSIGFIDKVSDVRQLSDDEQKAVGEGRRIKAGMEFFESELLEMSLTDVPANPGAVPAKETEEMVRKYLAEMLQAPPPPSLTQRIKDLELEIIKAINSDQLEIDYESLESLIGHLSDLEYLAWSKSQWPDALDEIQTWIDAKTKPAGIRAVTAKIDAELTGIITKPGFEETENEIRYRLRDPGEFQEDSFRHIALQKDKPRVFGIIGRLKGQDKTSLQALRFPKEDDWDIPKARSWVKDHPDIGKDLSADLLQTVLMED